jgi:iron donor protein CyaY
MTDQEFHSKADEALTALDRALSSAADEHGFEIDMHAGALTIEFDNPPARFVVSPNSPVKQIWVSALNKSFKLDFDDGRGTFVLRDTGQTLTELVSSVVTQQVGRSVGL